MRQCRRAAVALMFGCVVLAGVAAGQAVDGPALAARVAAAKSGTTVTLPEGTFALPGLVAPPGVGIRGSGYDKTILIITGQTGIEVSGGMGVSISDLTVQGAANTGVQLDGVQDATLARIRAVRCLTGIMITGGRGVRAENCVAAENRTGLAMNGAEKSAVMNCTLVGNSALGLSLSGTRGCVAFNNVLANNAIGVFLTANDAAWLDHNVYWGSMIGKGKDIAIPTLPSWRAMERLDRHSVFLPLDFTAADRFVYKAATALPWAQDRAMTAGWGAEVVAGFAAPKRDIDGQPWLHGVGAGAWEAEFKPARPADGSFDVESAAGYKSAGLYDADNRLVAWLFQMLPLRKGGHRYWVPSRDWQGRPIPAGKYTLRISEADLTLQYLASAGNDGVTATHDAYASTGIDQVVYDGKDRPILCLHWSESYRQFRGMDPGLQHDRWMIPGCAPTFGAASDGHGRLYSLREADKDTFVLSRIDDDTGRIEEVTPGEYGWYLKRATLGDIAGIAVLGDTVYAAAPARNKLLVGPTFESGFDVAAPLNPCADRQRSLIWLVSERANVLALDTKGAVVVRFAPQIRGLFALAVQGDRLALLSPVTGKVHLYDIADPANPKAVRTIGTGDGPYGPIQTDRFQFQSAASSDRLPGHCKVALDSQGTVAVTDVHGVRLFAWDGTPKRQFDGIWGQYIEAGMWKPGEPLELVDLVSLRTLKLDEKTRTAKWGAAYGVPPVNGFRCDNNSGFFFLRDGKRFGFHRGDRMGTGKDGKPTRAGVYLIARYDGYVGTPLVAFGNGADGKAARFDDFQKDFSDLANWTPVLNSQGQPIASSLPVFDALVRQASGDMLLAGGTVFRVPLKGLNGQGIPDYDFDHLQAVRLRGDGKGGSLISPYDYTTVENEFPASVKHAEFYPDGTIVSTAYLKKTGHGSGLCNWSGTEVFGYNPTGVVRWVQPMAQIKDPEGTKIIDDLSYTISCPLSELQIVDKDGLVLGVSGAPAELYWEGMWLDNSHQFTVLKGSAGRHYVVFGNFNDCTAWWMEVKGVDAIRRHAQPLTIDAPKAELLAGQAAPPVWRKPSNLTTQVKIVKLAAPLPIDGDMAKWRALIPTPPIIITPETGSGIGGPADASAMIRLAHEGGNLYVQMIRFDNLVTMHQPLAMFYKQDAIEMAINSFTHGIKINVTHTRDRGDVVYRDGWFLKAKELDPAQAPRVVKVFENARDIPERALIEQIYGVDLSASKVILTEFKVPLDDATFEGRPEAKPAATSGSTMCLGLGIDDNDAPGADLQKMMVWPATYNTFADKSASAVVVFE